MREVFTYSPETGGLSWKVSPRCGVQAGTLAGGPAAGGYAQVKLKGNRYLTHRVAYALHHGMDPGPLLVDHIDRDKSNNRVANLRLVSAKGNRDNSELPRSPVQVKYPGGEVRLFSTTGEAATALGCAPSSIRNYARGIRSHPEGLQVSYI